jgi:hypothetical protein
MPNEMRSFAGGQRKTVSTRLYEAHMSSDLRSERESWH